jgi:hypothetical protein
MKSLHSFTASLVAGWFVLVALAGFAGAQDWPDGYVVSEDTESPDHHYGILVPTMAAWEKDETLEEVNYLADLKGHRLLGKISGADYFAHQNHRSLRASWAEDSRWCLVQYDQRFGFELIAILEPKDGKFVQTDLGKRIQKALAGAIHDVSGGDAVTYYRFDHGKVLIRVSSTTDPKQLDVKHGRYAFFRGTYDVPSKKWFNVDARRVSFEDSEKADALFGDIDQSFVGVSFPDEKDKLESLDGSMNAIYGFLRVNLSPARFVVLKKEQIEWLKKRDAAPSTEEKCKLVQSRTKALQNLIWQE